MYSVPHVNMKRTLGSSKAIASQKRPPMKNRNGHLETYCSQCKSNNVLLCSINPLQYQKRKSKLILNFCCLGCGFAYNSRLSPPDANFSAIVNACYHAWSKPECSKDHDNITSHCTLCGLVTRFRVEIDICPVCAATDADSSNLVIFFDADNNSDIVANNLFCAECHARGSKTSLADICHLNGSDPENHIFLTSSHNFTKPEASFNDPCLKESTCACTLVKRERNWNEVRKVYRKMLTIIVGL